MTHKYFPYYDSGNNIFTILFCSLVFFFRYDNFSDGLFFYVKLFIWILPIYRLKFLSLSILCFKPRPKSIFMNVVGYIKKTNHFISIFFISKKEMIRNRLSWWQGYLFRKFIKLCWKPHFCTLAISRLIKGQHTTNTQQSIKMRTEYVTKNQCL